MPVAPVLRGPSAACSSISSPGHWAPSATASIPRAIELPTLSGNRRAFAQSLWRHLLFGLVLGELERRLNAEPEPSPPPETTDYSSNGHGRLEHTVSVSSYDQAD